MSPNPIRPSALSLRSVRALARAALAVAALVAVAASVAAPPALAAGGSSKKQPKKVETDTDKATAHYNAGLAARDRAWELEDRLEGAAEAERAGLEKQIAGQFETAIRELEKAVAADPQMAEAHGSLGYALRRTGDFEAALAAYDRALELDATYAPALEYRAEAYLGLDRPDDAKRDYAVLVGVDRPLAAALLDAMRGWIEARRAADARPKAELDALAAWVEDETAALGRVAVAETRKGGW